MGNKLEEKNQRLDSPVDRLVMRFLEMKRKLHGDDAADKTEFTYIGNGMYNLILPCKGGVIDCGMVHENTIRQMTTDMINILGV